MPKIPIEPVSVVGSAMILSQHKRYNIHRMLHSPSETMTGFLAFSSLTAYQICSDAKALLPESLRVIQQLYIVIFFQFTQVTFCCL